jgi:hypothetical protein
MSPQRKSGIASVLLIAIATLALMMIGACRKPLQSADGATSVEQAGEPEQYSSTITHRTFRDGTISETNVTQETRSGVMRREEWTEGNQHRALIWRPDLGKSFLLDLDRREYFEQEITGRYQGGSDSGTATIDPPSVAQKASELNSAASDVQGIDHYFDDTQSPASLETKMLPSVVIDSHLCRVYEQRTIFVDGHIEMTRRFRAEDLAGLCLRIECESVGGGVRVTTERRDVRIDVTTDKFVVPADFKRIERLNE